jgi:hypothetical protein
MKRDMIQEITTIKDRNPPHGRMLFYFKLNALKNQFKEMGNKYGDEELYKYIPIAIVACFETYFQELIAEIIDFGEPYSHNAVLFNQTRNVRFDFEIVHAVKAEKITIGQFISHILPFNNLMDVQGNVTTLLGIDFLQNLKTYQSAAIREDINEASRQFKAEYDHAIKMLNRTYELRHIFCHEYASNFKIDKTEILECLRIAELFLQQVSEFTQDFLYPGHPKTQAEINMRAYADYQAADEELQTLIAQVRDNEGGEQSFTFDPVIFDQMIGTWKIYRDQRAEAESLFCKGGTMYPCVRTGSQRRTTQAMIEELKSQYPKAIPAGNFL